MNRFTLYAGFLVAVALAPGENAFGGPHVFRIPVAMGGPPDSQADGANKITAVAPVQAGPVWFALVSLGQDAADLAHQILDEARTREEREQLIDDHPALSVELLRQMTVDLQPGTDEEYRRIPWIWRVTIAAGRRNDPEEIRAILQLSLPNLEQPLRDWQAVVIGGGIINGISQSGVWPGERLEEILKSEPALAARWRGAIELAATMADNHEVRTPTRYDALRIIALDSWERRGPQLVKYLAEGVEEELQMGAISGLADMRVPQAGEALLLNLEHYSDRNRSLALDALMRSESRQLKLLEAVQAGRIRPAELGQERIEALQDSPNQAIQRQAEKLRAE